MLKLCKQTGGFESKVMMISVARWPRGWLLCSSVQTLHCFRHFLFCVCVFDFVSLHLFFCCCCIEKCEAEHAVDLSVHFITFFISPHRSYFLKDETLEFFFFPFLIHQMLHNSLFYKLLLCLKAPPAWRISCRRAEREGGRQTDREKERKMH